MHSIVQTLLYLLLLQYFRVLCICVPLEQTLFPHVKRYNAIHQLIEAAHRLPTDYNRIDLSPANVIASRVKCKQNEKNS